MRDNDNFEHALGLQGADDGTRTDDIVFAAEPTREIGTPRPCPFCGSHALLHEGKSNDGTQRFWISCRSELTSPHAHFDEYCFCSGPHRSTAIDALDAWNYRPRSFLTARKPGRVSR